jgi:hypothetical protein
MFITPVGWTEDRVIEFFAKTSGHDTLWVTAREVYP